MGRRPAFLDDATGGLVAAGQIDAPSYAPSAAAHQFDPRTDLYNAKAANTRRLRIGLGRAIAGTGYGRIAIIGDSKSDQYNGSGPSGYDVTYSKWPYKLRSRVANAIGARVAGTGFVKAYHAGQMDARWTTQGSGWSVDTINFPALYNYGSSSSATGATFSTITTGESGTVLEVEYVAYQGNHFISVDGALTGTGYASYASTTGGVGGAGIRKFTITGLPDGPHQAQIWGDSGIFIVGASLGYSTGLRIDNFALNGAMALQFSDPLASDIGLANVPKMVNVTHDLVICVIGVNDMNPSGQNATPAATVGKIQSIRGVYPNSDFLLVIEDQPSTVTDANYDLYSKLMYQLADTLDVPLLDLNSRYGRPAVQSANGYTYDGVHQNAAGDADWASAFAAFLIDSGAAGKPSGRQLTFPTSAAILAPGGWARGNPVGGMFALTLPAAPTDLTPIIVDNIAPSGTNQLIVQRGGSTDLFDNGTSAVMLDPADRGVFEYSPALTQWQLRRELSAATAGTTVRRNNAAQISVGTATAPAHAANKAYVDPLNPPYGPLSGQLISCPRVYGMAAATSAQSGQAKFHDFLAVGGQVLTGLAINVTTAQVAGTGTLVKGAVYADRGDGGGPLVTSAGLLGQVTFTVTSTGFKSVNFGTAVTLPTRGRYWTCFFYYAGTVAPTTAPLCTADGGATTLPSPAGSLVVVRYLNSPTGLTDLPVGSQTLTGSSDAQGVLVYPIAA